MAVIRALSELAKYSSKIPDHTVHSNDRPNTYKVRVGFFLAVAAHCSNGLDEKVFNDPDKIAAAQEFVKRFGNKNIPHPRLTTQSDIEFANETLGIILGKDKVNWE